MRKHIDLIAVVVLALVFAAASHLRQAAFEIAGPAGIGKLKAIQPVVVMPCPRDLPHLLTADL